MGGLDARKKVMLIDSDAAHRERLAALLGKGGVVLCAESGARALELLEQERGIMVMVLQCRLSDMSGFDLMMRLRSSREYASIPVLAIGEAEDESRALSMGAVVFCRETMEDTLIVYRVQNLLNILHTDLNYDALTGLRVRESFMQDTRRLLTSAESEMVLVYLNINRFKILNDLFGQAVGDHVLQALGRRLNTLEGSCVVGRLGEDHFGICCARRELDAAWLRGLADQVMEDVGLHYGLRIYFGIYLIEDKELPVEQMCDRAQMAMASLSEQNTECVSYYNEKMRQELLWEQMVTFQMQEALDQRQFELYLQPIFSLSQEMPVAAEALVRWNHPTLGLLPPGRFIPIFESNGQITKLDWYIWEETLRVLARMKEMGYPEFAISVNMSRVDLYEKDICPRLVALAKQYGVDPSVFRIEVTESAYIDETQQLLDTVQQFNAAGFSVMMDDFGSGYSSLNMLMDMPVSTLKIDQGFVRDVGSAERSNCIVSSIIRMAKWLEMTVVAEGVETRAQMEYLRSIGCDRVQGYYYSKPLPRENFFRLLADARREEENTEAPVVSEQLDVKQVWSIITACDQILGHQIGAAGIYEQTGDTLELLQVSDTYYQMMETSPDMLQRETQEALAWLVADDRASFESMLDKARETNRLQELLVRRYVDSARIKSLLASARYLGRRGGRHLYLVVYRDVSGVDYDFHPHERAIPETGEKIPVSQGRKRVLVVEDGRVNRMMLAKMLGQDYEVVEATNGRDGLDQMEKYEVSAVLLDIIMPIMDGYEFLRSKATDPSIRDVPVLMISQIENKASINKAIALGASGFIRKPFAPEDIRRQLEQLTQRT